MDSRRCSKLTIPPSSDSRPLVFHSDRQALPIARLSRQGLLALAITEHIELRAMSPAQIAYAAPAVSLTSLPVLHILKFLEL